MRVRSTLGLLLVAVFGVMPAWPQAPAGSQLLVLTNANVIDGVSEHPIRQATVIEPDRGFECDCHSSDGGRFNHLGGAARRREPGQADFFGQV